MVKRPTTPEAPDDEPRYLTVVHPYPLNGVMEDPKDQRRLVLWLACCTGKDDLFSFFHKPSAPGMIVIEVNRYFDGFDRLLGEHKWSQFLTSPTEEEADRVSRVYYCTLNTGRKVEKTGWKRVNIPEHWFYGWHPNNKHIAYPYPPTSYCPVPDEIEDKTNFALCRRLPAQSFPPPAPPRAPPPGSAQWHDAKSKGLLPTAAAFKSNGAWNKGPPKRAAAASPSPIAVPTPPMSVRSASNSSNPWTRGLPSRSASPLTPALSASSYGSPALSSPVLQTPQVPPGLDVQRERKFSWSEDVERSEAESESVQFDLGPYGYQDALRAPSRAWSGEDSEDGCSSAGTSGPRTIATAMADLSFGVDGPMPRTELVSTEGDEEEQTDLWKDVQDGGAAWTGYADPKEDKILPWKWDCPEHGIKCSKGICQLRGKQEKEAKWAAETAKRQAEKEAREIARSKKAQKKARKENGGGDDGWNNVPRRGSGPRSNSGSDGPAAPRSRTNTGSATGAQDEWKVPSAAWGDNASGAGDADDVRSVASSARKAWSSTASSVAGDDNEGDNDDDDARSVASSRTSGTSRPRSEWASSPTPWDHPTAMYARGRGAGNGARGKGPGPQPQRQQAWGKPAAQGPAWGGPTPGEARNANASGGAAKKGGAWGAQTSAPKPGVAPKKSAWDTQSVASSAKSSSKGGWEDASQGPW